MKLFYFFFFSFGVVLFSSAQITSNSPHFSRKKNAIYLEKQGSGTALSIHYNRIVGLSQNVFLDANISIGANRNMDSRKLNSLYAAAICVNFAPVKFTNAYFFAGIGGTLGNLHPYYEPLVTQKKFLYPIFGLKYQPAHDNIYFKFYLFPHTIYYQDKYLDSFTSPDSYNAEQKRIEIGTGISIGYAFNGIKKTTSRQAESPFPTIRKNAVFLQILGESVLSLGYNRILLKQKSYFWDMRALFGANPIGILPLGAGVGTSLNWGRKAHFLETGISYYSSSNRAQYWHTNYVNIVSIVLPVVGYKLITHHFFFRTHFTPLITYHNKKIHSLLFGGMSVGYAF